MQSVVAQELQQQIHAWIVVYKFYTDTDPYIKQTWPHLYAQSYQTLDQKTYWPPAPQFLLVIVGCAKVFRSPRADIQVAQTCERITEHSYQVYHRWEDAQMLVNRACNPMNLL